MYKLGRPHIRSVGRLIRFLGGAFDSWCRAAPEDRYWKGSGLWRRAVGDVLDNVWVPESASGRLYRGEYRHVREPRDHLEMVTHVMRCSWGFCPYTTPYRNTRWGKGAWRIPQVEKKNLVKFAPLVALKTLMG